MEHTEETLLVGEDGRLEGGSVGDTFSEGGQCWNRGRGQYHVSSASEGSVRK